MIGSWGNKNLLNKKVIGSFISFFAKGDNWHQVDINKANLGYGWIHYGLIRLLRAKRVLCIGSRFGYVPAICAMACKDNGEGTVDFVDASYDMNDFEGPGKHWGGLGWWKKCDPEKYFGKFGLEKNINLWVMTSEEYLNKFPKRKYGYIHIDGDHSYEGVAGDFKRFWPMLRRGGFLAIHDIGSPDKDGNVYGTRKLWSEIRKSKKYRLINFLEDPGVGIIQKD